MWRNQDFWSLRSQAGKWEMEKTKNKKKTSLRAHRVCHRLNSAIQRIWGCHPAIAWPCHWWRRLSLDQSVWIIQFSACPRWTKEEPPQLSFVGFVFHCLFLARRLEVWNSTTLYTYMQTHTHAHTPLLLQPLYTFVLHAWSFLGQSIPIPAPWSPVFWSLCLFSSLGCLPTVRDKNWMMPDPWCGFGFT